MRRRAFLVRPVLALALGGTLLAPGAVQRAGAGQVGGDVAGDATVIAVIDSGFSPYHLDYLAARMPAGAAVPLAQPPHRWLPGFPNPSSFRSYEPLDLRLPTDGDASMDKLYAADAESWQSVRASSSKGVNYRWIPGTKVIGALQFGPEQGEVGFDTAYGAIWGYGAPIYGRGGAEHGMGSASVAVGNINGSCPQCLLVFIQYTSHASAERAVTWAMKQPWIDAVSNSYGMSATPVTRDRVYNGSDLATQKAATERGQTVFFSSGNGVEGGFVAPNSTLLSSQEGPDWIVTVGATNPRNLDYTGSGKPADIAGIGSGYPSAYESTTASNGNTFSGTSNATPQVAGTYAQALWQLRRALPGPSRAQARGVVARGPAIRCDGCELGDGTLTAGELRRRLLHAATPRTGEYSLAGRGAGPAVADTRFAAEGHGSFRGLLDGRAGLHREVTRIVAPALGKAKPPSRPAGETEWFRVDSWCRQHVWGAWAGGYYLTAAATPLPALDPAGWPTRSAIQAGCPALVAPPARPAA